ncbi:MAG: YchJ family metal-binding protein [Sulfurospirillaceae bacterium]|nr:YchJ family metal-binding protein [Sulfurospirillaceae bacterium]MDD3463555.1 YchJ family metal-binding protein [Sulfurospirillaceae bacterium]
MSKHSSCPCDSGKPYEQCCEPYHRSKNAPTCEDLMRSRYSAFVFGLVDYLYETTHPNHRNNNLKEEIASTCKGLAWTKLEVLSVWQGGEKDKVGKVSFRASFVQDGKKGLHVEHSRFRRFIKAWMYVDGKVEG